MYLNGAQRLTAPLGCGPIRSRQEDFPMKRVLAVLAVGAALIALSGCYYYGDRYGYRYGYGPYSRYNGYYDGYYGNGYGDYDRRYDRDYGRHYRRDSDEDDDD
jgi:hypothetical protein